MVRWERSPDDWDDGIDIAGRCDDDEHGVEEL